MTYLMAIVILSGIGGALAVLLLLAGRYLCNYGPCPIQINDREPFVVDGGGKLLDALYAQRIFIPSACGGQGTCGFCRVQVLAGGGPVLPTERLFLSEDDVARGFRLACQVKVREALTVQVKPDYLDVREYRAEVLSARLVTPDTREVRLRLLEPGAIVFRPGQYVQVMVPDRREPTYRAYSIASPPSAAPEIELLVRRIPDGIGSGYLHRVEPGDEVVFTGPYGDFVLEPDAALVCVGGGCGMAPMRSILRHLAETRPGQPCWLFFGARTAEQAMYRQDFEALSRRLPGLRVHYALSEPQAEAAWDGETGFIHESVERHLRGGADTQVFLCGPPAMITAAMAVLTAKGIPRERIFYDEF